MDARTARRHENVRILLRTLNDIYPGPQALKSVPDAGAAPSRRVPCRVCNLSSQAPRKRITGCLGCDGDGWRPRRAGEPAWDEMTGKPIATSEAPKRAEPMSPQRLEAELAKVQRDLRLSEGLIDPNEQYGWERAREARDRDASYRDLESVLGLMQIEFPVGRSAVTTLYFTGLPIEPSTSWEGIDEIVVSWIAERMPGRIKIPRRLYDEQQAALKREVAEWLKAGASEIEIAEGLGVSRKLIRAVAAGTLQVSSGTGYHDRQRVV